MRRKTPVNQEQLEQIRTSQEIRRQRNPAAHHNAANSQTVHASFAAGGTSHALVAEKIVKGSPAERTKARQRFVSEMLDTVLAQH